MWLSCRTLRLLVLMPVFLFHCSAAEHEQQRQRLLFPSVMVVGTVYCDTCFQEEFSESSHLISGASVAVECVDHSTVKPIFRKQVKTDSHGEFRVQFPPTVSKHIHQIETCSVKLIRSNEPYCAVASSTSSSVFHHKSRINNVHVFSAGFFAFKPLKKPELCNQEPSITKSSSSSSPSITTTAITDEQKQAQPEFFPFPTIPPLLPSPPPNFGGIPLPPNPLQPPSVLPPLPFQPSPPPLIGIPPIPFITPPPPPPPAILPPIPLLPSPLFPGIPPASP